MDPQPHSHFDALRERIRGTIPLHAREEYARYDRWLYGAIGDPSADIMFICQNPPPGGVEMAHRKYRHLGIEAQWRGKKPERFRRALRETGFLRNGQWRCYVTNVIKELVPPNEWKKYSTSRKRRIAPMWSEVLQWEICKVQPRIVICVGKESHERVRCLVKDGLVDLGACRPPCRIPHYSRWHKPAEAVVAEMVDGIRRCVE